MILQHSHLPDGQRERERESMGYLTALLKGDREKEKESERKWERLMEKKEGRREHEKEGNRD